MCSIGSPTFSLTFAALATATASSAQPRATLQASASMRISPIVSPGREIAGTATIVAQNREADPNQDDQTRSATACLRTLTATMADVSDTSILNIVRLDSVSDGLASRLITNRLLAVGYELPRYASATDFLAIFGAAITRRKRGRLH